MNILIVSNTPWDNSNSFGNSFSNIFGGMENLNIANIFCRYGGPNNNIVQRYFQITEKSLIANLKNRNFPSGKEIFTTDSSEMKEIKGFSYARKNRCRIFYWIRDLIWFFGRWKSKELTDFVLSFKPDIIFTPVYYSTYLNDINLYIKKLTDKPMLGYISDDCYTLRQLQFSPFYWFERIIKRRKVKKVIDQCEILYVISDIQKKEYDKCFNKNCKILSKGKDFIIKPKIDNEISFPIKMVYTGNVGGRRYKQLSLIGKIIACFNIEKKLFILDIYTQTPLSDKMKKALDIPNAINMKGAVSASEVFEIQKSANILVHTESFDYKTRLAVRQSFSTKLVDYFYQGKCIFAVGPKDVASIDYLMKNDAAVVATNEKEIYEKLKMLVENPDIIREYGDKAWDCGKRNHQIDKIQKMLYEDFERVIHENSEA